MKPKISTVYPFDYEDMISKAKYLYLDHRCGNHGNETRPRIVTEEGEDGKIKGFSISIYKDGIEINSEFSSWKNLVEDLESLTLDVNKGICDWLVSSGSEELINYD